MERIRGVLYPKIHSDLISLGLRIGCWFNLFSPEKTLEILRSVGVGNITETKNLPPTPNSFLLAELGSLDNGSPALIYRDADTGYEREHPIIGEISNTESLETTQGPINFVTIAPSGDKANDVEGRGYFEKYLGDIENIIGLLDPDIFSSTACRYTKLSKQEMEEITKRTDRIIIFHTESKEITGDFGPFTIIKKSLFGVAEFGIVPFQPSVNSAENIQRVNERGFEPVLEELKTGGFPEYNANFVFIDSVNDCDKPSLSVIFYNSPFESYEERMRRVIHVLESLVDFLKTKNLELKDVHLSISGHFSIAGKGIHGLDAQQDETRNSVLLCGRVLRREESKELENLVREYGLKFTQIGLHNTELISKKASEYLLEQIYPLFKPLLSLMIGFVTKGALEGQSPAAVISSDGVTINKLRKPKLASDIPPKEITGNRNIGNNIRRSLIRMRAQ